jgi:hypothetical protein
MWPAAAALVAATLAAGPAGDRVLVCRARISGDPALARGDALAAVVREAGDRILDYGVPCESTGEAARAARRAGLGHAVVVGAEGRTDGSLFELTVVDAEARVVSVRRLAVPPGDEVARPLESSLDAVVSELRRPETRRSQRRAAIGIAGGGAALLAAGAVLAGVARGEADRANGAATPGDYLGAKGAWERSRTLSGVALGLGGAVLAAGIVWRIDLQGED